MAVIHTHCRALPVYTIPTYTQIGVSVARKIVKTFGNSAYLVTLIDACRRRITPPCRPAGRITSPYRPADRTALPYRLGFQSYQTWLLIKFTTLKDSTLMKYFVLKIKSTIAIWFFYMFSISFEAKNNETHFQLKNTFWRFLKF